LTIAEDRCEEIWTAQLDGVSHRERSGGRVPSRTVETVNVAYNRRRVGSLYDLRSVLHVTTVI
jgi:hypothetical protein